MNTQQKTTAAALAVAAGLMLPGVSAMQTASAAEGTVHCYGINACSGKGACATATNACAGHNSCKGQGWLPTKSAEECEAKGGTVK
jgi:hypothetical protein